MKITCLNNEILKSADLRRASEFIVKAIKSGDKVITGEALESVRKAMVAQVDEEMKIVQMPENEVEPYLKERITSIPKETFEEEINNSAGWTADRKDFSLFIYKELTGHLGIHLLIGKHNLAEKFVQWIDDYAAETYPAPKVEPLPKMPKRPKKHISANNKLMTALTTGEIINAGAMNLAVMPNDGITTYVMATYDIDKEMAPFNLSPFERTVMDAVCSIYRQAKLDGDDMPIMTPTSIYKAMPGAGARVSESTQEKIAAAVTKMRHIFVTLDASSELLKLKKIKPGEKYTKETNMLLAEEHTYRRQNGTISIGWQLFQKPVAYEYAEITGQIVNVPAKVMQIEGVKKETGEPDGVPYKLNENRRELLAYLVRRVAVIKNAHNRALEVANWKKNREAGKSWQDFMTQNPVILYESAFEAAGVDNLQNRHTVKDCKDFCRLVFDYWKAIDYIPAYGEVKEGRTARGLKILF